MRPDHDLIVGQVVAVHVDDDVFDDAGRVNPGALDLLFYNAGEYWSIGSQIPDFWYSNPKKNF
jgi:flavin reductase (DIM6/NTAB) family NADH-FMN oxidoreductase RutF